MVCLQTVEDCARTDAVHIQGQMYATELVELAV